MMFYFVIKSIKMFYKFSTNVGIQLIISVYNGKCRTKPHLKSKNYT